MQVHENYSLKKLNTFGIDVYAKHFAAFNNVVELTELLERDSDAKFILGGGSNILFTNNFNGFILKNNITGIDIIDKREDQLLIKAGAGVNWHQFVLYCVDQGLGGVENLSLIPGNVGASPMQNIGAYGVEIKDVFYELEAFDIKERVKKIFSNEECEFGYRESIFKKKYKNRFVILNVTFQLRKDPVFNISYGAIEKELNHMGVQQLNVKAISDAVTRIRTSKLPDPKTIGNAGSFFKNPVIDFDQFEKMKHDHQQVIPFFKIDEEHYKIPAGWLIEQCGWKGFRSGDVGCYEKQALVLVNFGNARGEEIYALSEKIKKSVMEKFNIVLEREVNIV